MLSPTSSGGFRSNPYSQLIQQTIAIERQPQLRLKQQRGEQERLKSVISDFQSSLSALSSQLETFQDPLASPFAGRAATTDEGSGFSVSATDDAALGSHSVQVERLASADTRVSKQYSSDEAGTDTLRTFFDTNGAQSFEIAFDHDPSARVKVRVDPQGTTNEAILKEIAGAIDEAVSQAVEDETISADDEGTQASVVREDTGVARLSLRSGQTGERGTILFTDSTNGILAELGINNAQKAESAGDTNSNGTIDGGWIKDPTALDAQFQLDGLTLTRSTNQVDDALDGVTLDLNEATGTQESFTVSPDNEGAKGAVEGFIEKYNAAMEFISGKSEVDGEKQTRGDFAGDYAIRNLRFQMRSDIVRAVEGQPADGPQALTDLGIEINRDGTLKLADTDALEDAVKENQDAVQQLFGGDDGVAARLEERLDRFLGGDGILDNRENSFGRRIDRLDDRIERWDTRLERRKEQLTNKYAQLQESLTLLRGQQSALSGYLEFGGRSFF